MTKKILALALAGTTAFSVFASAMSVSAVISATDYTATALPTAPTEATLTYKADSDGFTADHFEADYTSFSDAYTAYKALKLYEGSGYVSVPDWTEIDEAKAREVVYLYDYGMTEDDASAYAKAVDSFLAAYESAKAFHEATPSKFSEDGSTDPNNGAGVLTALNAAAKAVSDKQPASIFTTENAATSASRDRYNLVTDFEKYVKDLTDPAEFETSDVKTDYATLYGAAKRLVYPYTSSTNSYLIWLKGNIEELTGDLSLSTVESVEEEIETYKSVLDARTEDDYASSLSYRKFEVAYDQLIEDYDSKTTASKRKEYRDKLWALIKEKHGDSAGADKDALKTLLETADSYTTGNGYKAGEALDKMNAVKAKAREIYRLSAKGSYQSTIDAYVALLSDAMDAVSSNGGVANWQWLRLENAVEAAGELVETDYTASSWKKVTTALANAEKMLETTNASPTLVEDRATKLEEAIKALSPKAVPSATKKALQDALKEAKTALAGMDSNSSGYQMVALTNAITNADNLFQDNKQSTLKDKTLISAVEAATAALEAALTSANQPQGWYTNEAGKWMYGEGDGYYVDGWKKIGNFWFEFDANGVAKQNEWVNEGGKWYYFGNSCVAYTGWGKIDGKWYYFGKDCAMVTGWIQLGTTWYYLTPGNGEMVTGWATIGGKSYYFSKEANTLGAMLANTTTPDGYKVGADGAWVK